jgi:hypothetical protein
MSPPLSEGAAKVMSKVGIRNPRLRPSRASQSANLPINPYMNPPGEPSSALLAWHGVCCHNSLAIHWNTACMPFPGGAGEAHPVGPGRSGKGF